MAARPPSEPPEVVDTCNLCGGRSLAPFLHQIGMSTGYRFTYVRCTDCGLKFVSPRLSEAQNAALYDESYFHGAGFDPAVDYVMLEGKSALRAGENEGIIGKIGVLKGLSRDLRILDVGCGTGSLLGALHDRGFRDIWGLDLSEFAAKYAMERTKGAATVKRGSLLDTDFGGAKFDVVNATEVVEHLRDPRAFFERLGGLLAPGGVFLCSTGNASGPYARLLGSRWPYFHPEGHLFYYSPSTLARYYDRAQMDVFVPSPRQRAELLRCEDAITRSQLAYMGASAPGMKGIVFAAAARFTRHAGVRAATLFQGKCALPLGVRR